ncbi:MAG: hypothetical protein QXP93_05195 [Nitrososphaerota archaeon]
MFNGRGRKRDFRTWKAQMMAYLVRQPPSKERDSLIEQLEKLRSRWPSSFLADLSRYERATGTKIPNDLLPREEEIEMWSREGGEE